MALATAGHQVIVGETGWPAAVGKVPVTANKSGAQSSVASLQIFLDSAVCELNKRVVWFVRRASASSADRPDVRVER